jgi:ATP-binding protein involved in chromosome partitioning
VNLAFALAMQRQGSRVGVLDLDVFGPSIPKLMGVEDAEEPELTKGVLLPTLTEIVSRLSCSQVVPLSL